MNSTVTQLLLEMTQQQAQLLGSLQAINQRHYRSRRARRFRCGTSSRSAAGVLGAHPTAAGSSIETASEPAAASSAPAATTAAAVSQATLAQADGAAVASATPPVPLPMPAIARADSTGSVPHTASATSNADRPHLERTVLHTSPPAPQTVTSLAPPRRAVAGRCRHANSMRAARRAVTLPLLHDGAAGRPEAFYRAQDAVARRLPTALMPEELWQRDGVDGSDGSMGAAGETHRQRQIDASVTTLTEHDTPASDSSTANLCVICLEGVADAVFYRCGHRTACLRCAHYLRYERQCGARMPRT